MTTTSSNSSTLPRPRSKPLRAGSKKEDAIRRYAEEKILHISRRFTKKFQPAEESRFGDVKGYVSFEEVAVDLGGLADVVWLSATPNLQTQYLLSIAGILITYLPAFPPVPSATLSILKKMDHAFSSLLKAEDIVTGEALPGFSGSMNVGFSKTDMVRLKGLVEETRVLVVNLMGYMELEEDKTDPQTETSMDSFENCDMDVARVYEHTIVQLEKLLELSNLQSH
ncbi:putative meiotic recombination protein dmc1 [Erysiphe necator]|uniref:Putative meiotic recombination protein dmc1 n=1 Tax=Uncinula necator TaxID=52586 RepID=A0A0B1P7G2_UNCNE|nr:putative meiotic recombination protein dmc1 [Erysiphe necator]